MFWAHLAVIVLFYTTPFYLHWQFILIGVVLFYIQIFILGNCILTLREFTGAGTTDFHYYYLTKLGIPLNERATVFYTKYLAPLVILGMAILWQIVLSRSVPL